jgi:hypothetical protein
MQIPTRKIYVTTNQKLSHYLNVQTLKIMKVANTSLENVAKIIGLETTVEENGQNGCHLREMQDKIGHFHKWAKSLKDIFHKCAV